VTYVLVICYGLDDRDSIPGKGRKFSLRHHIQAGSGVHPASYPMNIGGLSTEIKRPGREAIYSPPSSAEVKNAWLCTSTPPVRLTVKVKRLTSNAELRKTSKFLKTR
jgi:hypothetical protein